METVWRYLFGNNLSLHDTQTYSNILRYSAVVSSVPLDRLKDLFSVLYIDELPGQTEINSSDIRNILPPSVLIGSLQLLRHFALLAVQDGHAKNLSDVPPVCNPASWFSRGNQLRGWRSKRWLGHEHWSGYLGIISDVPSRRQPDFSILTRPWRIRSYQGRLWLLPSD